MFQDRQYSNFNSGRVSLPPLVSGGRVCGWAGGGSVRGRCGGFGSFGRWAPLSHALMVDLMGRLSNPSEAVKTLILQGSGPSESSQQIAGGVAKRSLRGKSIVTIEKEGRLSNPIQRRLPASNDDDLVNDYAGGSSINELAHRYRIHRNTVMIHLKIRGVESRRTVRKLTNDSVAQAATLYAIGLSLAKVAQQFGVSEATVTREFRSAGLPIRPRKGGR